MKRAGDIATGMLDAAARRERYRKWHWCRRDNGFTSLPKWRVIGARLTMPAHQVAAFANWLDELGNEAGNIGLTRGEVSHFNAAECGVALGMSEEDAARIFIALEEDGWIVDGHIGTFYDRNKDTDDDADAARHRKRRQRARDDVRAFLADLGRRGLVDPDVRADIERRAGHVRRMADDELFRLVAQLQQAAALGRRFSTGSDSSRDSHSDNVTGTESTSTRTPELSSSGDNSGASTRGEEAGPSEAGAARAKPDPQAEAVAWLQSAGVKIVTQRTDELTTTVQMWIERWLHQRLAGDAPALRQIIETVAKTDLSIARFLTEIDACIKRHRERPRPQLPLGPAAVVQPPRKVGHG